MIIKKEYFNSLVDFTERALLSFAESVSDTFQAGEEDLDMLEDAVVMQYHAFAVLRKMNSGADEIELTDEEKGALIDLIDNEFQSVVPNLDSGNAMSITSEVLQVYNQLTDEGRLETITFKL